MPQALGSFYPQVPCQATRKAVADNTLLIVLCLLPILFYLPVMVAPFERDEGVYATIAQRLLRGDVPYRDLFDNKPPIIYGWYAVSFLLLGENAVAPRLVASLLLSLTTLAVFAETYYLFSRRVAYLSAGAFAVSTGIPFVALHANTEAYMVLPLVASFGAFMIGLRRGRLVWLVMAGGLAALAIMTKQVAVWNLVALAVAALAWRWGDPQPVSQRVARLLALLLGASAVVAVITMPFLVAGALGDFVYATVSYNWVYARFLSLGDEITHMLLGATMISALAAPLVGASVLGLFFLLVRSRRPIDYILVVWAAASALGVASGGRFFPHYFFQLVPAMILIAAVVLCRWLSFADRKTGSAPLLVAG